MVKRLLIFFYSGIIFLALWRSIGSILKEGNSKNRYKYMKKMDIAHSHFDPARLVAPFIINASTAILVFNRDYTILFANRASPAFTGSDPASVIGKTLHAYLPERNMEEIEDMLSTLSGKPSCETSEKIIILSAPNDSKRAVWYLRTGIVEGDRDRWVAYLIARDFSREVMLEERLDISEERYRQIFDNSRDGIVINQNRFVKLVNPMTCQITGYSREELLEHTFADFIHPDDIEVVLANHFKRQRGRWPRKGHSFVLSMLMESPGGLN